MLWVIWNSNWSRDVHINAVRDSKPADLPQYKIANWMEARVKIVSYDSLQDTGDIDCLGPSQNRQFIQRYYCNCGQEIIVLLRVYISDPASAPIHKKIQNNTVLIKNVVLNFQRRTFWISIVWGAQKLQNFFSTTLFKYIFLRRGKRDPKWNFLLE